MLKSRSNNIATYIRHTISGLVLVVLLISCEEIIAIDPEISQEKILVLEGGITDEPPPYHISLRTAQYISGVGENTLGVGAIITLSDNTGKLEVLIEETPGNYKTTGAQISGQVGGSYKLHIELANGEQYQSDYDIMPSPVVVDYVYEELVSEPILNNELTVIGHSVFHKIYTNIENDKTQKIYIKATQRNAIIEREVGLGTGCEDFGPPICYVKREINISDLFLISNLKTDADNLNLEIAHVPIEYKGLYYTSFSIESISPIAHDYYSAIKKQLETAGTIFDPLIPSVPGNIYGINGTKRTAEGYFRAYAISWADICYSRANVALGINIPPACDYCWRYFAPAFRDIPPEMQNCQ